MANITCPVCETETQIVAHPQVAPWQRCRKCKEAGGLFEINREDFPKYMHENHSSMPVISEEGWKALLGAKTKEFVENNIEVEFDDEGNIDLTYSWPTFTAKCRITDYEDTVVLQYM